MRPAKRGEVEAGNRVQPGDDAAREAGRGGGTSQPHSGEGARRAIRPQRGAELGAAKADARADPALG
jgi:hypothetical protein